MSECEIHARAPSSIHRSKSDINGSIPKRAKLSVKLAQNPPTIHANTPRESKRVEQEPSRSIHLFYQSGFYSQSIIVI